jgi:NTE family protein
MNGLIVNGGSAETDVKPDSAVPQVSKEEIGLALSGGGFRAALFALGTLWRLNDCGWLPRLNRIASVSGGSITSAYLGMQWKHLKFDSHGVAPEFDAIIAEPIERFCSLNIDIACGLKGLLTPGRTVGDYVARAYEKNLYRHEDGVPASLRDLPPLGDGPEFILYATNLQTGSSVRFTHAGISDYRLGSLPDADIKLAQAVGASSAFPPFLSPVQLKTKSELWRGAGRDVGMNLEFLRSRLILSDGGVYDNLGTEAILGHCRMVIVSDAGAPADVVRSPWINWFGQLARVRVIMMEQTRALRRRMVMATLKSPTGKGTLWRIGTQIGNFQLADAMTVDSDKTRSRARLRTRLNRFTPSEQGELINWGYALCDAGMRKHVDTTIPKGKWPRPRYAL